MDGPRYTSSWTKRLKFQIVLATLKRKSTILRQPDPNLPSRGSMLETFIWKILFWKYHLRLETWFRYRKQIKAFANITYILDSWLMNYEFYIENIESYNHLLETRHLETKQWFVPKLKSCFQYVDYVFNLFFIFSISNSHFISKCLYMFPISDSCFQTQIVFPMHVSDT